jgi:hypothetical protein
MWLTWLCVQVPGMIMMKDVSIAMSEYQEGERAINKIQDFQVSVQAGMHLQNL